MPSKPKHPITPHVREGLLKALREMAQGEERLPRDVLGRLFKESMEDDFLGTLNVAARFMEREKVEAKVEHSGTVAHNHATIPLSDSIAAIIEATGEGEDSSVQGLH